jgi:hypothetical protein
MRLDGSGRVGIGTATFDNAAQVLVVKGDASVSTSDADNSGFNFTAVPDTTTGKVGIGFKTYNETASAVAALYATPISQYRNSLTARYNADSSGGYFSIEQLVPETASVQERLRIDASGNVGIGTSSPNEKLNVSGNIRVTSGFVGFSGSISTPSEAAAVYRPVDNTLAFSTANTERMRIDSSGNVGIGVASAGNLLHIHKGSSAGSWAQFTNTTTSAGASSGALVGIDSDEDFRILQYEAKDIKLYTSTTERMRIAANGNVLIGQTVASGNLNGIYLRVGQASGFTATNDNAIDLFRKSSDGKILRFYRDASEGGWINVTSTSVSLVSSSDERLKENIVDAPAGNIDAIRVRSFDWKVDGSHQTYGMVAQELVDVAPEAVSQGATEDDMWGVDYSKLVPMMIKEIQDLKAEVAALKGA